MFQVYDYPDKVIIFPAPQVSFGNIPGGSFGNWLETTRDEANELLGELANILAPDGRLFLNLSNEQQRTVFKLALQAAEGNPEHAELVELIKDNLGL